MYYEIFPPNYCRCACGLGVNWLLGSPVTDLSTVVLRTSTEAVPTAQAQAKKPLTVDWQMLRELDYRTGEKSPAIAQLVGDDVIVRVPGFMIPLEDVADAVTEFFLTTIRHSMRSCAASPT